jgi:outer membrane protein TolC
LQQASRVSEPPQTTTADRTYRNWLLGFGLAWELDVFGRIRREAEAATAVFLATEQAQRGVLITLIADVAQSYFTLRELDLELEISRRTLKLNDDTVEFYARGSRVESPMSSSWTRRSPTGPALPKSSRNWSGLLRFKKI